MPRAGELTSTDPLAAARYPLEGRHVCPFCGSVNETMEGPCPQCTMTNTAETRKATKSRIGPWYVLQSRNPAAPGMRYETLLGFVRKGRVKARSIVRGPTTHQLWRFACQVKGLSREFGLCYSCGGSIERDAQLCPQCNRLQDPPADPDVFLEGQGAPAAGAEAAVAAPAPSIPERPVPAPAPRVSPLEALQETREGPIFKELKLPPLTEFQSFAQAPTPPVAPSPTAPPVAPLMPAAPLEAALPPATAPVAPAQPPQAAAAVGPAARPAPVAAPAPVPATAPAPEPVGPPKRNAGDVFLSAKDLAAAFQLEFQEDKRHSRSNRGDDFDHGAPWTDPAAAHAARPAHRRHRRKRRTGRLVLVLLLLAVGAFAAYLAVDVPARRRVFDWAESKYMALTGANLYPDLARPSPQSAGADRAVPASASVTPRATSPSPSDVPEVPQVQAPRAATEAPIYNPRPPVTSPRADVSAEAVARPAPRPATAPSAGAVSTPRRAPATTAPATAPAVVTARPPQAKPAQSQPAVRRHEDAQATAAPQAPREEPQAPRLTRVEAQKKSRELWDKALDAEERGDYRAAKALYEQIMTTLPKEVWYQGIEVRLRVAKDVLGEK